MSNGDWEDRIRNIELDVKEVKTEGRIRWNAHDKKSDMVWGEVKDMINKIFTKMDGLQCQTHTEKFKSVQAAFIRIWAIVMLMLAGCIGGFFWMLRSMG